MPSRSDICTEASFSSVQAAALATEDNLLGDLKFRSVPASMLSEFQNFVEAPDAMKNHRYLILLFVTLCWDSTALKCSGVSQELSQSSDWVNNKFLQKQYFS